MHHRLFSSSFLFMITLFMYFGISSSLSQNGDNRFNECSLRFECGLNKNIKYPFWGNGRTQACGRPGFELKNCQDDYPVIEIMEEEYRLLSIDQDENILTIVRLDIWDDGGACPDKFVNTSLDDSLFDFVRNYHNLTFLYNCSPQFPEPAAYKVKCSINGSSGEGFYVKEPTQNLQIQSCKDIIRVPVLRSSLKDLHQLSIQKVLKKGFNVKYKYDEHACSACDKSGGQCGSHLTAHNFMCFCPDDQPTSWDCPSDTSKTENHKVVILATVIPTGALVICLLIFLCRKKWKSASSNFLSRNISADPSSKSDLERGTVYFGVPVFSYGELEEATNNFDPTKELGDGGFGTVYHGKLQDGREVAVKRLYEHNYKRVEQFMNEVEILTRLRHKNLVSLYGCTSRHSRELLLVYEFIPNGTVADHLHGDRAKPCSLTWSVRMSIAIETADALAYLHASDTIHRDVKTTNILLDHNFSVKVADFGISRLFPTDVTHVSTAPQGTPGYVDPEYHQCYQLTDRSDVYSFGVVLIELISSLPAVDISRHRQEINLANLAKNKIQKRAFSELVDPGLGFESNLMVRRMTTSVAELAFRCLQQDKEMRPSMDEVFEVLKGIESEKYEVEKEDALDDETRVLKSIRPPTSPVSDDAGVLKSIRPPTSPVSDDAGLLKNMQPLSSPNSVTEKWVSRSTTPSAST